MLNSGEIRYPCLVPEEMLSVFHCLEYLLWVYHIWPLLCWGIILLYTFSAEGFFFCCCLIINGCWIWSKASSASIEMIIQLLAFNLFIWCITLFYMHVLKNPCIPGIKSTWSQCMILLMCCWIVCWNFVQDFCIYVHKWYWPVVFFFFLASLTGYGWIQGDGGLVCSV